jgi:hypothetical protein
MKKGDDTISLVEIASIRSDLFMRQLLVRNEWKNSHGINVKGNYLKSHRNFIEYTFSRRMARHIQK